MNIGDLVARNARLHADEPAFVAEGRMLTHQQFADRAFAVGNALLSAGLSHQNRVAVLMRNRIECLELMFGCASAGLVTVVLNWRLSAAELTRILRDCEPAVLIYDQAFAETAQALLGACASLTARFVVGADDAAQPTYESLFEGASTARPDVVVDPEDIDSLVYTSGTTGDPKGVMLSHRAMIGAALATSWEGGPQPWDRVLIVMPFFHVGGKIEQMAFWVAGGATYLQSQFDAEEALRLIESERLTAAHLAPTMIAMLLDQPTLPARDCSSLRLVHYASAPMPVPLLRRAIAAFGPIFVQVYGMTECVLGTILKAHLHRLEGSSEATARLASAGQPYLGVDIRIEKASGEECATGEAGEILLNSPSLMTGYWNRTAATLSAMRDGWMRTGDIGYLDRNGFLFIVDRLKDMIVSGGENIYSREVEEALAAHPAVREAAVVGTPDAKWGESVFAFVVPAPGASIDPEDLIGHCRKLIASYKKPRFVHALEALPRIHNGKIDKKELRLMARRLSAP